MSISPSTPKAKASFAVPATPVSRVAATTVMQSSPHYATTRRHSLYGIEDRIIIDPGSRIWKVGFSGEGRPRDVFCVNIEGSSSLWKLERATDELERAEEDKLLEVTLERCLRSVFHSSLLADPKSRKVIIIEQPLLPLYLKDMMARILFENLQVPSVSFASSHLLSLFAAGRITGLVLDCGHLESTALPIFAARPLFPYLRTTPLAGDRFTSHLRALLLLFATYLPPPTSLSAAASSTLPASSRSTRVPEEILTDAVIEEIKNRCCFVGEILRGAGHASAPITSAAVAVDDDTMDVDLPPSSDASAVQSESEFDSTRPSSEISAARSEIHPQSLLHQSRTSGENHLQALASMYTRHSTATEIQVRVVPTAATNTGTGGGTLIIPGWIRERAAEVLFEGGDVDESSVAEVILDTLLKAPVDLRRTLASSILITGGTPMLPGFIPRLHHELLRTVSSSQQTGDTPRKTKRPRYDRYATLRPLLPFFAIINNPSPASDDPQTPTSSRAAANAGKAPAFSSACMAWVGGSLAGALKTGGVEVSREKWDEASQLPGPATTGNDEMLESELGDLPEKRRIVLPDWTRTPLPIGAPSANAASAV